MSVPNELPLFRKLYSFMIVMHRCVHNIPREYKYTLGAETVQICWKCLDLAVVSSYAPKDLKTEKILQLSTEFDKLNLRIRAMQELKIISAGQFAHWQKNYLFEIGRQIGGWLKWAENVGGGVLKEFSVFKFSIFNQT